MATIYELPVKSDLPSYQFQVDLDGATYGFGFTWNESAEAWFMSLSDVDGNPLVTGVRVVVEFPLAARSTMDSLPPGVLLAVDTSGQHLDPGLGDLGSRVRVQYLAVGEDG
jgi:hypothetical protein